MISDNSRGFLKLLLRSPDIGEGWRKVSKTTRPLVEKFPEKELLEIQDHADGTARVRLSEKGRIVVEYAV